MSSTTLTAPPAVATPADFERLAADLRPLFIKRDAEIDRMILALVGRCHLFFLSKPGTAKSMLVDQLMARIADAIKFSILFDKFSDDGALFGPPSIAGLKEGSRRRESAGYLPWAHIFFADEIWKGSEAMSNSLLKITNERVWFDDGVWKRAALWVMYAASNELPPNDGNMAAIFDRAELRVWVDGIEDPTDMVELLRLPDPPANPAPVISWDTVVDAHQQAMDVVVPDEIQELLVRIQVKLRPKGVQPLSGRRQRTAQRLAKATAWLDGCDTVEAQHLEFLTDFLWDTPTQRPDIRKAVFEAADPDRAKIAAVTDQLASFVEQTREAAALEGDPKSAAGGRLVTKLQRAAHQLYELEGKVKTPRSKSDVDAAWTRLTRLWKDLEMEVYALDEEDVPNIQAAARKGKYANV